MISICFETCTFKTQSLAALKIVIKFGALKLRANCVISLVLGLLIYKFNEVGENITKEINRDMECSEKRHFRWWSYRDCDFKEEGEEIRNSKFTKLITRWDNVLMMTTTTMTVVMICTLMVEIKLIVVL